MEHLDIKQFKCFVDAKVAINGLTIMAGANGNGKSSAIQALLLLRRYIEISSRIDIGADFYNIEKSTGINLPLNGCYSLALGTSPNALNKNFLSNVIQFVLYSDKYTIDVEFETDVYEPQLWLSPVGLKSSGLIDNASISQRSFYYLNAERVGPRIQQAMNHTDFPSAGWKGEETAQLINLDGGYWKVSEDRMYAESKSQYIKDQINYWLDFIMPGIKVTANADRKALITQILLENRYTLNDPGLSTNLGFGTSYLLPIIATGLVAQKGAYFIVENPEAHLHPSAQSKVGRFLAKIASTGVKVIIETHSDHVINGVQIAAASNDIPSNMVSINYFNQEDEIYQPVIKQIDVNGKGELSEWPKGFFDQTQLDFIELMKLRGGYNKIADNKA